MAKTPRDRDLIKRLRDAESELRDLRLKPAASPPSYELVVGVSWNEYRWTGGDISMASSWTLLRLVGGGVLTLADGPVSDSIILEGNNPYVVVNIYCALPFTIDGDTFTGQRDIVLSSVQPSLNEAAIVFDPATAVVRLSGHSASYSIGELP